MPDGPRVTVVMPVRNAETYLAEAVESVLGQTLEELELIAVDDGSDDGSRAILERFAHADPRVRVVAGEGTRGLAAAANRGWRLARAPYVARMDADDVALPERLARQVEFLHARPTIAAVGGAAIMIDQSGRRLSVLAVPSSSRAIRARLLRLHLGLIHTSVTLRRSALEQVGGYRFDLCGGVDLWLRLSERFELANLPEPVVLYRVHAAQTSIVGIDAVVRNDLAVRAAAKARAGTGRDPLAGVHELTPEVLAGLGIDQAEIDRMLEVALFHAAGRLVDIGRREDAERLVARASQTLGPRAPHAFAAAQEIRQARIRLGEGRRRAAAHHALTAWKRDPRYTSRRVADELEAWTRRRADRFGGQRPASAGRNGL